jgi:lysophospholipid acyltransferase (LPLAT)-like uncharacterized protein
MTLKSQILGRLAYMVTLLLKSTLTICVSRHPDYDLQQQYLFAFWHGKQLLPVWELRRQVAGTKRAVLVSPSKDGDLLTVWLKQLGYKVIRGSSRRRNVSALVLMMRQLKDGYSLGFGIDGPIGPIYKVKPGMTHMAQKLNIPIVPVGSAFSQKWLVKKAWDKYEIPKPFSKASFYLGQPYYVKPDADLETSNQELEVLIHEAETKALALL